ncbi:MAG TPA: vWA domain-containing protein [Polyangiaceae bacterium]|nr:vWA domain-containing protein [Polyangiaceae bacterium]
MTSKFKLVTSLLALALASGCSSDEGDGDGSGAGGNGAGNAPGTGGAGNGQGSGGVAPGTGGAGASTGGGGFGALTGSGGDGPVDGGGGFGAECAGEVHEPENGPAVLQLVVDTSLSMNEDAPGAGNDSKWEVTRDALATAIDALSAQTSLGLMFYPNRSTGGSSNTPRDLSACVEVDGMVPIAALGEPGSTQRMLIAEALEDARPNGSTPTHDAYKYALDNSMRTTTFAGSRYMLLITDGVPTYALDCVGSGFPNDPSPTDPIVDEIEAAAADGIKTFIVGSPGSEDDGNGGDARPWMSRGAMVGGTASMGCSETTEPFCHFDMTQEPDFAAALQGALDAIAGAVVSCNYNIPAVGSNGDPVDRNKVNVTYTPGGSDTTETILYNDDPNCTEGWRYEGESQVLLCPDTCSRVQADARASLQVVFGCTREDVVE